MQIGEAISSGGSVYVALAFGVLEAKDRKFTFTFNPAALSKGQAPEMSSRGSINESDCCATDGVKGSDERWEEGFSTYRYS